MADLKISELTDGAPVQAGDQVPVLRSGANVRAALGTLATQDASSVTVGALLINDAASPELRFGDVVGGVHLGKWLAGIDQAATPALRDYVAVAKAYTFAVTDGVLNSSTTLTSATAQFNSSSVGYVATGTGIPGGTTIASVTNATTVVLSAAATVTASGVRVTFSKAGYHVTDLEIWTHHGFDEASVGFGAGVTSGAYRVSIMSGLTNLTQGTLHLMTQTGGTQTGDLIRAGSTTDSDAFRLKADGTMHVSSGVNPILTVADGAGTVFFNASSAGSGAIVSRGNTSFGLGALDVPTATMDCAVLSTSDATFNMRTASWGSFRLTVKGTTPGTVTLMTQSGVPMAFGTTGVVAATITTAQKVGIATTAPDKILEVNLGTADAFRLTYNDANGSAATYMDTTLSSAGVTTFTGVGSAPTFNFSHGVVMGAALRKKAYTVATLPAAVAGDEAFVTDSLAPAFLVAVAGGGAAYTPVGYTGAAWVCA